MQFDNLIADGYQVEFHSHAEAILTVDFPEALVELVAVLENLSIPVEKLFRSDAKAK